MNQYTWEYLAECSEFENGQTFVTVEDFEKEVVFRQDKIKQLEQELQKTRNQLESANAVIHHVVYSTEDSQGLAYEYLELNKSKEINNEK